MIGILCLIIGYPYRIDLIVYDLGEVDLVHVGRVLVYLSLVYSLTSGASYVRLFAEAVDAKARRQAAGG
jgi:CDP-diacylglycerol--glycerol-3-phosphate 3-phosphatidyltransferase